MTTSLPGQDKDQDQELDNIKSKNVQRHYNQNTGWPTPLYNFYKNATVDKGCGENE